MCQLFVLHYFYLFIEIIVGYFIFYCRLKSRVMSVKNVHNMWSYKLQLFNYIALLKKKLYSPENIHKSFNSQNTITVADALFENKNYQEVYEYLKPFRFYKDEEVLWRMCRALYKITTQPSAPAWVTFEMIDEAYNLMNTALSVNEENAEVHKWLAIILSIKSSYSNTSARVESSHVIKHHLMRAAELNPNDYSVLYMLGQWCYSMSSFSWLQRKIMFFLYGSLPQSSYAEAYKYFEQAEELKPRFYIPNMCMLGKINYLMSYNYRARYYLNLAAHLTPHTDFEREYVNNAKKLEAKLEFFDLAREAVLNDFAS